MMLARGRRWARGKQRREVGDGRDEVVAADLHQEVDGIEVLFTTEAAAEVGDGVDRRVELLAEGTEEAEVAITFLVGPLQHAEDVRQGNLVAQAAEEVVGITVAHGWAPEGGA